MDDKEEYYLVFNGQLVDKEKEGSAKNWFSNIFEIGSEDKLFDGLWYELSGKITKQKAIQYQMTFEKNGIITYVVPDELGNRDKKKIVGLGSRRPKEFDISNLDSEVFTEGQLQIYKNTGGNSVTDNGCSNDLSFNGDSFDYAKLYFKNMFINIITIGIGSLLVNHKDKQFFAEHTLYNDENFEYAAGPFDWAKLMLISSLVMMASIVFVSDYQNTTITTVVLNLTSVLFVLFSTHFLIEDRVAKTNYLGSNFVFNNVNKYKSVFLWFLVLILSLGLMLPLSLYKAIKFYVNGTSIKLVNMFGSSHFVLKSSTTKKLCISVFFQSLIVVLLIIFVYMNIAVALEPILPLMISLILIKDYLYLKYVPLIRSFNVENKILGITSITNFNCKIPALAMWKTLLKNIVFIILTAGIYRPWAVINIKRLVVDCSSQAALNKSEVVS